jgi:serine O-acetyltransferase
MIRWVAVWAFGGGGANVRQWVTLMGYFNRHRYLSYCSRFCRIYMEKTYGCYISEKATIADSVEFRHPNGIVIGEGVTIGEKVVIYQQVTLGGGRAGDQALNNYPSIGCNCVLFSGSKILGAISVGDNSIVGANAVVISTVPENSVAVGVPAKYHMRNIL